MKSAALVLWLTLFGNEPGVPPASVPADHPAVHTSFGTWAGEWLVAGDRRRLVAVLSRVGDPERVSGRLSFGDAGRASTEHWIGRIERGRLLLSHAGVGEMRLVSPEPGRLVGRLNRRDATGAVTLSRQP